MPQSITQAGQTTTWSYGPEHDRYKMAAPGRTTYTLNPGVHQGEHYEQTQYTSGTVEHRHTLYGGGRPIGEYLSFDGAAPPQTRYFHSDHQGSITAVTDNTGAVLTRYKYDPWGKQTLVSGSNTGIDQTRQGHTAHEMLDGGLTHMNGRLYDPVLSRFVSADPYVDNPFDLQGLNRYSYVNNNPLGFTDPTGYLKLFGKKWSWWRDKVVKPVVAAYLGYLTFGAVSGAISYVPGAIAAGAVAGGVVTSVVATGSLNGWQYNALGIVAFSGAGLVGAPNSAARVLAHAAAGCVTSSASGGDCGSGALSAGFSKLGTIAFDGYSNGMVGVIASAVIGGTASVLGGGKFENGAATGAFGYLYNFLMSVHKSLTLDAAKAAGLSVEDSRSLALGVKGADFVDGSQDPSNAHWHSMCSGGDSASGCLVKQGKFLSEQWNSKSLGGFARFLHAVQDSHAAGHGGKVWLGGIPSREHIEGDGYPAGDRARQIIEESASLIRAYKSFCPKCFPTSK